MDNISNSCFDDDMWQYVGEKLAIWHEAVRLFPISLAQCRKLMISMSIPFIAGHCSFQRIHSPFQSQVPLLLKGTPLPQSDSEILRPITILSQLLTT